MNNTNLKDVSTSDLKKKENLLKILSGLLLGMLFVLFVTTLYMTFTHRFTPLFIIPIALLPIVILNFNSLNKIKEELRSRENQ